MEEVQLPVAVEDSAKKEKAKDDDEEDEEDLVNSFSLICHVFWLLNSKPRRMKG